MKKKVMIVLPVIIVIVLISIVILFLNNKSLFKKTNQQSLNNYNSEPKLIFGKTFTKDGILGYDAGGGHFITITDYKTGKCIPLCNKPNCKHEDETCNANVDGMIDMLTYYNNKLYIFTHKVNSFSVIQADNDGSNRKTILESNGQIVFGTNSDVIKDGKLFFTIDKRDYSGTDALKEMPNEYSIVCYDFISNQILTIYDMPKYYNITFQNVIVNNDNLIFDYAYTTVSSDNFINKETNQPDDELSFKAYKSIIAKININTKEYKTISDKNTDVFINAFNNNIYLNTFEGEDFNSVKHHDYIEQINIENGETKRVLTNDLIKLFADDANDFVLSDEIILNDMKNGIVYIYDMNGNLKNTVKNTEWFISNEYEDMYMLIGNHGYRNISIRAYIKKSDFIAGNKNVKYIYGEENNSKK